MDYILEIPGLGDIIFKEISTTDLAHLRVTRSLRTIVSHHAGRLMESYDRSLKKRCDRILKESDNKGGSRTNPEKCIYSTPYKCVYNYYYMLVKLSFICPEKQVFLDEIISYLQTLKQVTWGFEYLLVDGYYRAQGFTNKDKSLYDIASYIHLNSLGKKVNESTIKFLENKLLPVTIE